MSTDETRLPVLPIQPWQRPPTTRNTKGRWVAGVSGNPRGRPTNVRLRAKALACDARTKRPTAYRGMSGAELARVAAATYGRFWQGQLASELMMSRRGVIRWVHGDHKILLEKEILLLSLCLRRVKASHAYVRAMLRRALVAHSNRVVEKEQFPRHKPLTPREERRTVF
jgi:hypothetical protein